MKLKDYIKEKHDGNASEFARMIGVSRQCVYYWINTLRIPSVRLIRKIEKLTGGKVTYKDW